MAERLDWITAYERSRDAGAVCRHYSISRATLRKWWLRYEAEGPAGLVERSRAPQASPTRKAFAPDVAAILALRAQGLGFGRIRAAMQAQHGADLSVSTIRRILGRSEPPAPPPRIPDPGPPGLIGTAAPQGVAAQLAEAITAGQFRPGEKLAEEALARRFRAGRTKVREALRSLAFLGLVRIERNRGAFVPTPSQDDIARAYEARRVVEAGILRDLSGRLTEQQLDTLRRHIAAQATAEAAGQRVRLVQLLTEFHVVLAGMGRNGFLRGFVETLTATTSLAVLILDHAPTPSCAVQEHRDLVDHLAKGETQQAVRLMMHHLGSNQGRLDQH